MSSGSDGQIGVMPRPPGVAADLGGVTSLQQQYIIVASVMTALGFITLALRVYTRRWIVRSFGLEDYAIIFSFIVNIGFLAVCLEGMNYGFGRHLWDVPALSIPIFMKFFIPLGITYIWAPALAKLSTLLLFHRLNNAKPFRYIIYAVMFITAGYTIAGTFVISVGCSPTKTNSSSCVFSFGLSQSALNIFTDLMVFVLPIPLLRKLQMPLLQKIVLGLIFSIGSLVIIVSIVRLYYNVYFLDQPDFTYYLARSAVLSAVELNCAIICNCLVVLKPLVNRLFPKLLSNKDSDHQLSSRKLPFPKYGSRQAYELKSSDQGDIANANIGSNRIMVTKSYRVQGKLDESDSTENIIEPAGNTTRLYD